MVICQIPYSQLLPNHHFIPAVQGQDKPPYAVHLHDFFTLLQQIKGLFLKKCMAVIHTHSIEVYLAIMLKLLA